jgi:undecaprenyl diphosphate synthase
VFTDVMWPEFGADGLSAAVRDFHSRERRFGGLKGAAAG